MRKKLCKTMVVVGAKLVAKLAVVWISLLWTTRACTQKRSLYSPSASSFPRKIHTFFSFLTPYPGSLSPQYTGLVIIDTNK